MNSYKTQFNSLGIGVSIYCLMMALYPKHVTHCRSVKTNKLINYSECE
jgi:hypothetical protein